MSEEPQPQVLTRLSQIPYLVKWAEATEAALASGITIDIDGGLMFGPDVGNPELESAASKLMQAKGRSSQVGRVIDRLLGNLINHHSILNKITWAESIEQLGLCESDGRSMRSLSRLPRIVSRLDAEVLMLPDLTTKHFDQATAFKEPEDPTERKEWKEKVRGILIEASEDPTERGSSWVTEKMKNLQKDMGIDTGRSVPSGEILKNIAVLSYIKDRWTDEDYANRGIERSVVIDHYEELMNQALTRGIFTCPDNPVIFVFPWEVAKESQEPLSNKAEP